MDKRAWSAPVSDSEAYKRAGGRRRYNAVRRLRAILRRQQVAELLASGYSQAEIAERLGVSQSTISRDVLHLRAETRRRGTCPVCGRLL